MTSGRCRPSAADEEWYSVKRPYSTVAVLQFVNFTQKYVPDHITIHTVHVMSVIDELYLCVCVV